MIRPATFDDVDAIVDMSAKFYATTTYPSFARFDVMSVASLARFLISDGVMLVYEDRGVVVGMVGLVVSPFPMNAAVSLATEVVWWVEPNHRDTGAGVALLRAVAPACRALGASAIQMMDMADSPPHAATLYERMGYHLTERSYTKVM